MPLQLSSQINWGTNNENVLTLGYPLDNVTCYGMARTGSETAQAPSGTEDGWYVATDYILEADIRWIPEVTTTNPPASGYSQPTGLDAMLTWGRAKNTIRFIPNTANPGFFVDCYLAEDLAGASSANPPTLESDGTYKYHITLRNATVHFGQMIRGVMFEYAPGGDITQPVAATFTRTGAATFRGIPGTLASPVGASAATGVLRDRHYEGTLRTALLESSRTQLVTQPENFGAWSQNGTPTLTSGQADPFGGTSAYLIADTDPATVQRVFLPITFTGDGTKAIAIFLRASATPPANDVIGLWDNTASVWRNKVNVTWTAGVPSLGIGAGGGTLFPVENWGAGWYRCLFSVTNVVAANANQLFVGSDVAASTGSHYVFGANAWDALFPSSYQGPSLTTRNGEGLGWAFPYAPMAAWRYVKFVERGTFFNVAEGGASPRIHQIGSPTADTKSRWVIYAPSGGTDYRSFHADDTNASVLSALTHTHAFGDTVELLDVLYADGSVQLFKSINGGADVAGNRSAALALNATFDEAMMYLGSRAPSAGRGYNAFANVKIGTGSNVVTLAAARAA